MKRKNIPTSSVTTRSATKAKRCCLRNESLASPEIMAVADTPNDRIPSKTGILSESSRSGYTLHSKQNRVCHDHIDKSLNGCDSNQKSLKLPETNQKKNSKTKKSLSQNLTSSTNNQLSGASKRKPSLVSDDWKEGITNSTTILSETNSSEHRVPHRKTRRLTSNSPKRSKTGFPSQPDKDVSIKTNSCATEKTKNNTNKNVRSTEINHNFKLRFSTNSNSSCTEMHSTSETKTEDNKENITSRVKSHYNRDFPFRFLRLKDSDSDDDDGNNNFQESTTASTALESHINNRTFKYLTLKGSDYDDSSEEETTASTTSVSQINGSEHSVTPRRIKRLLTTPARKSKTGKLDQSVKYKSCATQTSNVKARTSNKNVTNGGKTQELKYNTSATSSSVARHSPTLYISSTISRTDNFNQQGKDATIKTKSKDEQSKCSLKSKTGLSNNCYTTQPNKKTIKNSKLKCETTVTNAVLSDERDTAPCSSIQTNPNSITTDFRWLRLIEDDVLDKDHEDEPVRPPRNRNGLDHRTSCTNQNLIQGSVQDASNGRNLPQHAEGQSQGVVQITPVIKPKAKVPSNVLPTSSVNQPEKKKGKLEKKHESVAVVVLENTILPKSRTSRRDPSGRFKGVCESYGQQNSQTTHLLSGDLNFSPPSPDPVAQVAQVEEDERFARRLQAEFDAERNAQNTATVNRPEETISSLPAASASGARPNNIPARESVLGTTASTSTRPAAEEFQLFIEHFQYLTELLAGAVSQEMPHGLERREINRLPVHKYAPSLGLNVSAPGVSSSTNNSTNTSSSKECLVCLCEYEINERLRVLPCFHEFHAACIDKWLKKSNTCPVCRAEVS